MIIQTVLQEAVVAAGDDIYSLGGNLTSKTQKLVVGGGGVIATLIVVLKAWQSKGAMAGIVSGFIAGVLVFFAVSNVGNSDIQDKVKNTFDDSQTNGSSPGISRVWDDPQNPRT